MWLNKLGGGVCIAFWILYALLSCYFLISFLNFNKLWYDYLRYYGQWMEGLMPCRDLFDQKGPLIWSMEWPFYCSNDFGWSFCWSWWPYLFPWHSVIRLMFYLFPPKRRFLFFCCLFYSFAVFPIMERIYGYRLYSSTWQNGWSAALVTLKSVRWK